MNELVAKLVLKRKNRRAKEMMVYRWKFNRDRSISECYNRLLPAETLRRPVRKCHRPGYR